LACLLVVFFAASVSMAQSLMTVRVEEHRESLRLARDDRDSSQQALALTRRNRTADSLPPASSHLETRSSRTQRCDRLCSCRSLSLKVWQWQMDSRVSGEPTDTEVGCSTQYVQVVNTSFCGFQQEIGALIAGPTPGTPLCPDSRRLQTNNRRPIVLSTRLRTLDLQPVLRFHQPFLQCIAVPPPLTRPGTYKRISFQTTISTTTQDGRVVDAYYETFNSLAHRQHSFWAAMSAPTDRPAISREPRDAVCFQQVRPSAALSDIDGSTPPPGSRIHVDFETTAEPLQVPRRFHTPRELDLYALRHPCCGFQPGVRRRHLRSQPAPRSNSTSLADRLMYRLAYRNSAPMSAGRESFVVADQVAASLVRNPESQRTPRLPSRVHLRLTPAIVVGSIA